MGFFKDAKAEVATKHGTRALEEGRVVFLYQVNMPKTSPEGAPVSGVAEQIDAIEAVGWKLDHMAFSGAGYLLFRRGW